MLGLEQPRDFLWSRLSPLLLLHLLSHITLSPGLGPLEVLSTYLKLVVINPVSDASQWDCSFLCASHRISILLSDLQAQGKDLSSPVDAKTVSQRKDDSSKVRGVVSSENWIDSCVPSPLKPVSSGAQRQSADLKYHFRAVFMQGWP